MKLSTLSAVCLFFLLAACASGNPRGEVQLPVSEHSLTAPQKELLEQALYADYVLASHTVRRAFASANLPSRITLIDGTYQSSDPALLRPFDSAELLRDFVLFTTLSGSTTQGIIGALTIGRDDHAMLEVVVLAQSGSKVFHIVSYPLGNAKLTGLSLLSGHISATVQHRLPSDPGERATTYKLPLPSADNSL